MIDFALNTCEIGRLERLGLAGVLFIHARRRAMAVQAKDQVLVRIDKAAHYLAEARTALDANKVVALADAAMVFAKRIDASREVANQAAEFRLRAELRLGEILKAAPKNPGTRTNGGGKGAGSSVKEPPATPTLAEAGIDRKLAARAQKLTQVPRADFEKAIEKAKDGEIHPIRLANELAAKVKSDSRKQESKAAATKHATLFADQPAWTLINQDVLDGLRSVRDHHGPARLIFADPPYNIGVDYGNGKKADDLPDEDFVQWCADWMEACKECLTPDGSLWVMINDEYADYFGVALRQAGFHRRAWIKWYETFGVNRSNCFNRTSRHIFYCVIDPKRFVFHPEAVNRQSDRQAKYNDKRANPDGKIWDDVWGINPAFPRVVGNAKERVNGLPTQLPVELVKAVVGCASDPGDLVVDPFNGTGTTGAACLSLGRKYIGIDSSEEYIDAAEIRLRTLRLEASNGSKTA